jgi:hypothetical protein
MATTQHCGWRLEPESIFVVWWHWLVAPNLEEYFCSLNGSVLCQSLKEMPLLAELQTASDSLLSGVLFTSHKGAGLSF